MTKEEALRRVKGYLTDYIPADNYEEVEEIAEALEQDTKEIYNRGFVDGQKALAEHLKLCKAEQGWIPVSEKLPDTDDEVLCWYEYYHWSREKVLPEYGIGGYLRETSAWFGEVATGRDVRVIAWMPLPEPYRAESEE